MIATRLLLAAALLLPTAPAGAAAVELLQPPAWLVRDGTRTPLAPDARPRAGDVVRTGERARVRLALAEGSTVKIGPAARVALRRLDAPAEPGGPFVGRLEVARGAFRLTTGQRAGERRRRIDVRVGTVTAGIRGTDIWGKTTAARDLVVLLAGEIEVSSDGRSTRLREPGTAYVRPAGAAARPGVRIDRDTIRTFARETEPLPGRGSLTREGDWVTLLDSLRDAGRARRAYARYRGAGYPVARERATVDGVRWHRIVLPGAASRGDARALARELEPAFGIRGAWAQRRP